MRQREPDPENDHPLTTIAEAHPYIRSSREPADDDALLNQQDHAALVATEVGGELNEADQAIMVKAANIVSRVKGDRTGRRIGINLFAFAQEVPAIN